MKRIVPLLALAAAFLATAVHAEESALTMEQAFTATGLSWSTLIQGGMTIVGALIAAIATVMIVIKLAMRGIRWISQALTSR